jgi:hypothetical protein
MQDLHRSGQFLALSGLLTFLLTSGKEPERRNEHQCHSKGKNLL